MKDTPIEMKLGEFGTFYASHACYPEFLHGSDWHWSDVGLRKLHKEIQKIKDADPRVKIWARRHGDNHEGHMIINGVAYADLNIDISLTPAVTRVYFTGNRADFARSREGLTDAARKWLHSRFDDQLIAFAREVEPKLRRDLLAYFCERTKQEAAEVIEKAEKIWMAARSEGDIDAAA